MERIASSYGESLDVKGVTGIADCAVHQCATEFTLSNGIAEVQQRHGLQPGRYAAQKTHSKSHPA